MSTFYEIQSDSSICMNQRRRPLKITACRVILRKLELSQQLPRGTSVPLKPREPNDGLILPPASSSPCLHEEMAASSTYIDSFSESAEDDWYYQLTGAYSGSSEFKEDNEGYKFRNEHKEPKQKAQDGNPVNKKAGDTHSRDNWEIYTRSEKVSSKPDECTREERIKKLKVLLEQQEKAVTNIQICSERTPEMFQGLSGDELMTGAFTDGICVQKNASLGSVQASGFLAAKNCANESSNAVALVSSIKKCDVSVQAELYTPLPQKRRVIAKLGLKDSETRKNHGLKCTSKVKNRESTSASIKVEHKRNGVIFNIEQLQGGNKRKVGTKLKSVKARGKTKSLERVQTISTSGNTEDRSKDFVGSASGRQQVRKRQASNVNAKGRLSQLGGGSCKRRRGSGSKKTVAVENKRRDEIEQLMKKEKRSCEEFMTILGLKCVKKGL